MITIFSIPKPFRDHVGLIQRNALASWRRLRPECEIILCGDDFGTAEAAREFGTEYLPDIARNEYGTPLLSSVFAQAARHARHDTLAYINADIILLDDFLRALRRIRFPNYLMVARRWNVELRSPWDFDRPDWERRLREFVAREGTLYTPDGIDTFVFPKASGLWRLPPFAVGRPCWDNWFIYRARKRNVPVIDVTPVVTLVHQNHGYGHVPQRVGHAWEGPEADRNRALMGGMKVAFTLLDATHVMTRRSVARLRGLDHWRRYLQTLPVLHPELAPFVIRWGDVYPRLVAAAGAIPGARRLYHALRGTPTGAET